MMTESAPTMRSPYVAGESDDRDKDDAAVRTLGEFRAPLIPCQIVPPTAPIAKALPKSERITHGLHQREDMNTQSVLLRRSGIEAEVSPGIAGVISVGHVCSSPASWTMTGMLGWRETGMLVSGPRVL